MSFVADDFAAPGCGDAFFDAQCDGKECGGLGCGFWTIAMQNVVPQTNARAFVNCTRNSVPVGIVVIIQILAGIHSTASKISRLFAEEPAPILSMILKIVVLVALTVGSMSLASLILRERTA